jgi:hypothetical protein
MLSEGLENEGSKEATEGTRLHAKVAEAITRGIDPGLSEEDAELVEKCVAYLEKHTPGDDWEYLVEERGEVDFLATTYAESAPQSGKIGGTPDVLAWHPKAKLGRVYDWKFYRTPLPEEFARVQMACYGIMAYDGPNDIEAPIECRCYVPYGDWEYKLVIEDVSEARRLVAEIVRKAHELPIVLNPGEVQCKYCPAAAGDGLARVEDLSPVPTRTLEDAYDRIKALEGAAERVKAELLRRAIAGEAERYQAITRRGRHRITDPIEIVRRLRLSPEAVMACMSVSVTELRALYREVFGDKRKKKEVAKEMEEKLGDVLERTASFNVLQRKRGVK